MSEYAGRQFVGIDLHRRRSVIVRQTESGEVLEATRITNDVDMLNSVMSRAGESPEVVLEATYGWYWAVDALRGAGAEVHLAHPLGVKAFEYRRVKNDFRDANDLADLLRMGRLPEGWIAPPATRELRELVRHRAKLVAMRSHCKCEVHAVLAKCGVQAIMSDLFGLEGEQLLDRLVLPAPYAARIQSLRRLIDHIDDEVDLFTRLGRGRLVADPGFVAVQQLPGVGPVLAAVFVAEIGDVSRFTRASQVGLLGRVDPQAPRVRHPPAPGPDHQAGIPAGAVGGGGVGQDPRRVQRGRRLQEAGRAAARQERRHRGGGSQAGRIRLLRTARPPRPCSAPARPGGGVGMRALCPTVGREAVQVMTPAHAAWSSHCD